MNPLEQLDGQQVKVVFNRLNESFVVRGTLKVETFESTVKAGEMCEVRFERKNIECIHHNTICLIP